MSNYLRSDGRRQSRLRDKLGFVERLVKVIGFCGNKSGVLKSEEGVAFSVLNFKRYIVILSAYY